MVLQLAAMNEIAQAPPNADPKSSRYVQGQKQVVELTEGLLMSFVKTEEAAAMYRHTEADELIYKRYTCLVRELLVGFANMDDDHLKQMSWISPVLLNSCIRSKNEDIRFVVQKLVTRTSPAPSPAAPYPAPFVKSPEIKTRGGEAAGLDYPADELGVMAEHPDISRV